MQQIVQHNQKHFFSEAFFELVINELKTNMQLAFDTFKAEPGLDQWQSRWQHLLQFPEIQEFLDNNTDPTRPTRTKYEHIIEYITQYSKTLATNN